MKRISKEQDLMRKRIVELETDVRRFAISLTGNFSDGEDLLQSTIERVLTKGAPKNVDLKRWMFRVCKNKWIDDIRAKKVRHIAHQGDEFQSTPEADIEDRIDTRDKLMAVLGILQSLSPDQRMALTLTAIEGLSYKEAADILDVPIGTIMSRVARARKAISTQLNKTKPNKNIHPFKRRRDSK